MLCLKLTAADGVLSIQATDGELGLTVHVSSVQVDEPGEALLPADKLTQITRACDDSTLSISTERNVTTIKGQHATFRVFGYEPREFPGVRDAKDAGTEFEVAAGTLRRLIHRTAFATSVDNSRYAIAGTLLERAGGRTDVEIIECHHRHKEDSPSGTALKFGAIVQQAMGQTRAAHGREGRPGARPAEEIGYHAVRAGDNPGEHTILFGMDGESFSVNVRATSRDCYARGALAAAKFLVGKPAGLYSMRDVLGIE
jgi:hypothetical protein